MHENSTKKKIIFIIINIVKNNSNYLMDNSIARAQNIVFRTRILDLMRSKITLIFNSFLLVIMIMKLVFIINTLIMLKINKIKKIIA